MRISLKELLHNREKASFTSLTNHEININIYNLRTGLVSVNEYWINTGYLGHIKKEVIQYCSLIFHFNERKYYCKNIVYFYVPILLCMCKHMFPAVCAWELNLLWHKLLFSDYNSQICRSSSSGQNFLLKYTFIWDISQYLTSSLYTIIIIMNVFFFHY